MSNRYDVIVIGAGHNGLTTAALLAKKGRKVLLLESRDELGGLAASEEFHPGFKTAGVLHDTTGVRRWVVEQLELTKHGLKFRKDAVPVFAPEKVGGSGHGILLWRDQKRAREELGMLNAMDAKAYEQYRDFADHITPFMRRVFDEFPPDITTMSFPGLWDLMKTAVSLRMLGKNDMMELLRVGPMCVADYLNEWFSNDLLKAALAGPAIYNSYTGPWSPGTNANLLLAETLSEAPVEGGPASLVRALLVAAKAYGVEIRANAKVCSVRYDGEKVLGVELTGGERLDAACVAAACHPKHVLLDLLPPQYLKQQFEHHITNVRSRGTTAKVNLALRNYPEFACRPGLKVEYVRTGEHFDELERAFDAVKYREFSREPLLEMYVPTLENPSLAPAGQHVLSILVHFAPYNLDGGWTDEKKAQLFTTAMAKLEQYAPGVGSAVIGKEVLSPVDIERRYGVTGGQLFHGEHSADQLLVRPTPECSRYATPFAGLYLCGSGSHPGGGITCAPGGLAAKAILSDM